MTEYTGAIVALLPADADTWVRPGGLSAGELHMTALYVTDDADTLSGQARADILSAVSGLLSAPVSATVSGVAELGDDDPKAQVVDLSAPGLSGLRDRVRTAVASAGVSAAPDKWPDFRPHMTVRYGGQLSDLADMSGQVITFDRIALMAGGETTAVPLGGGQEDPPMTDTWSGTIGRIGTPTGDGRILAPAGVSHRTLPLPLSWQRMSDEGHKKSVTIGTVETIEFDYTAGLVNATGTFLDPATTPEVTEARTLLDKRVTYPSMDPGEVAAEYHWMAYDEWGDPIGDPLTVYTRYEIAGATLVSVQAFPDLWITPDAPIAGAPALVAAGGPPAPPAAWFMDPALDGPTGLTVDDDGRVYGHLATWGTCHIGQPGCVTAPPSASGYAYFTTGAVRTAEGVDVPVGRLTVGGGHAADDLGFRGAAEHYDNAGAAVAVVAAGEDAHGIWVAGAVVPSATDDQVSALRRSPLSGDWRRVGGSLELVGALSVNLPGFPVPRPRMALAASGEQVALIAPVQPRGDAVAPVPDDRRNRERARAAARLRMAGITARTDA